MEALGAAPSGSNRPLVMTELLAEEVVRTAGARPAFESSPHFPRILGFIDNLGRCRAAVDMAADSHKPRNTNLTSRATGHHITRCQCLSKPHVPPVFDKHALRFLTLWTFTLPFTLLDKFPSAKTLVVAMGLCTWALFGLRELGVRAHFPFSWGFVDLKRLWREVMWDARLILEGGEQAAKAAVTAAQDEDKGEKEEEEAEVPTGE